MKQIWRRLLAIHQTSVLLSRSGGFTSRALVVNPKVIVTRSFSTHQDASKDTKESESEPSDLVKKEDASWIESQVGDEKLKPEVLARMKFFMEKRKRRKELLAMNEEELKPYAIGVKKGNLLELQEGKFAKAELNRLLEEVRTEKMWTLTEQLSFFQQDLDFRLPAIKRWMARNDEAYDIRMQTYNAQRNSVLGDDLAAAHFIVYRHGRVKFMGQDRWVDKYRTDQDVEENEEDLPDMQFHLCTLPTTYDPNYLVEAIDASNISLRYEGLDNLENLPYCRFLKLENCIHLEAWCMDKLAFMFGDRLEFLDISGCTGLTEGALCSLVRFRKLKHLIVRNLPQVKNMAVVCAILEDSNPDLKIYGVDYEKRLDEITAENEILYKKEKEIEDNTITVETVHGPDQVLDSK